MEKKLYLYKAFVKEVYDGDTITVDIDLGLKTFIHNEKIRLYGINAPELKGEEREKGLITRDYLRTLILKKEILLETIKDEREKYGRYLGIIWVNKMGREYTNVNQLLVKEGLAVEKKY